jgi:hypothetical protein
VALKKLFYEENRPLLAELSNIYKADSEDHDAAYQALILYILHKGGLLEEGISLLQFDHLYEAFCEGMEIMNQVIGEQEYIA